MLLEHAERKSHLHLVCCKLLKGLDKMIYSTLSMDSQDTKIKHLQSDRRTTVKCQPSRLGWGTEERNVCTMNELAASQADKSQGVGEESARERREHCWQTA